MNRTLILLVAVLAVSAAIRPGQGAGQASLVFTDITVIDATGAAPKRQMMVVIAGDKIARIESYRKDRVPKAARVIDARRLISSSSMPTRCLTLATRNEFVAWRSADNTSREPSSTA